MEGSKLLKNIAKYIKDFEAITKKKVHAFGIDAEIYYKVCREIGETLYPLGIDWSVIKTVRAKYYITEINGKHIVPIDLPPKVIGEKAPPLWICHTEIPIGEKENAIEVIKDFLKKYEDIERDKPCAISIKGSFYENRMLIKGEHNGAFYAGFPIKIDGVMVVIQRDKDLPDVMICAAVDDRQIGIDINKFKGEEEDG